MLKKIKVFRRNNVKVQNRRRKIRFFLRSLLLLLVMAGAGVGFHYLSLRLESLKIQQIQVEGASGKIAAEEIIARSALKEGQPIFSVNLQEVVHRLKEDPWMDRVTVTRRLPHTILLTVSRHEPRLLLSAGKFYYVGLRGEIFKELKDKNDSKDFPILTGLSRGEMEQDPPRAREILTQALGLLEGFEDRQLLTRLGLSEIHFDRLEGFSLIPEKERFRVIVGFDDIEKKLGRLTAALEKLKNQDRSFAAIDLNYEGKVILTM